MVSPIATPTGRGFDTAYLLLRCENYHFFLQGQDAVLSNSRLQRVIINYDRI
jgi:hypothetical protein